VYRIRFGRVDGEKGQEDQYQNEGGNPGVLQRVSLPLLEEGSGFPPFRKGLPAISFVLRLLTLSFRSQLPGGAARLTLTVPGDGGLTSNVAKAGALVSPALISPPSPLDRRRIRGLSTF
jgi:hypothetical protein